MKRFLREAQQLIRFSSKTDEGNEEVCNYLAAVMQDRGFDVKVQHVLHSIDGVSNRQFNLIGTLGTPLVDQKIKRGLVLSTHLDTVGPGVHEEWVETGRNPYHFTLKENKVYGLGTANAKLDFLCKLYAIEKFREKKLKEPVYLVGTCGGELGLFGVNYLLQSLALNPHFVLVGGPTNLEAVYAHKSLHLYQISIQFQQVERDARGFDRRIDLHCYGKATHGAYPHMGYNAILSSVEFLKHALEAGFDLRFTRLEGGSATNQVPNRSNIRFYLHPNQFEAFKQYFRSRFSQNTDSQKFRVELGGVGDRSVRFLPQQVFWCMTEVIQWFHQFAAEVSRKKDSSFYPPFSTVNFGRMSQSQNQIDLFFDIRLLPHDDSALLQDRIYSEITSVVNCFSKLNVKITRNRFNPSLQLSSDHQWVKRCQEAMIQSGLKPSLTKQSLTTEAACYTQAGYPAIVFGSGDAVNNSYHSNEYNNIKDLEKSVLFYEKMIENICT